MCAGIDLLTRTLQGGYLRSHPRRGCEVYFVLRIPFNTQGYTKFHLRGLGTVPHEHIADRSDGLVLLGSRIADLDISECSTPGLTRLTATVCSCASATST